VPKRFLPAYAFGSTPITFEGVKLYLRLFCHNMLNLAGISKHALEEALIT
jgi:hypothetical protein